MALGKGIPVINGFDLNSKLPLDSRAVADTKEEMNALVTNGSVTDGQLCYCKADKKLYVLKDNVWSEVGGGGGGGSELPEMIVTISTGGEVSIDMDNLQPNNYTITLNYAGALIKHSGFGAIAYMGPLDTPMKMFSGFFNLGGIYQIIQAFNTNVCTGGKALIAENVQPNALVMFNDNYNVGTFDNPNADGNYYLGFNRDYDDAPNWKEINSKTISLFGEHSILVPKNSADTGILPCTASDNGKVLSVVNGQASWATPTGGSGVTVTFED